MSVFLPTRENLERVAHEIAQGELAVLPTETVYGLAADALNYAAVAKIFELKGRPADNPLIVHVSSVEQIEDFADSVPDVVRSLAAAFMPGPLTVVLPKRSSVLDIVTGGLDTVAIRIPDHPACLAVIELSERALAMPSANPFMGLSPTKIDMLDRSIADSVCSIIDGGACTVGIESTVLDLTGEPTILRLGSVTREEIERVLSHKIGEGGTAHKAPGMYRRHYAPRTKCLATTAIDPATAGLVFDEPTNANQIRMSSDPKVYAQQLYASLADLDSQGHDEIFVVLPPLTAPWMAIWDRISKATATA